MGRKKPVKSKGDVGEEKMVASGSGSEEKITLLPVNTKLIWQLQVLFLFLWLDRVTPPPPHYHPIIIYVHYAKNNGFRRFISLCGEQIL